jgi:hypothetical protein
MVMQHARINTFIKHYLQQKVTANLSNQIPHFELSNLYRIMKLNSMEYSTIRYDFFII